MPSPGLQRPPPLPRLSLRRHSRTYIARLFLVKHAGRQCRPPPFSFPKLEVYGSQARTVFDSSIFERCLEDLSLLLERYPW